MDFAAIILFLILYYVRPQEWIGFMGGFHLAAVALTMGILGTFFRARGFSGRDLLRTPHDWMVVFFLVWVVLAGSGLRNLFNEMYPFLVYYMVTAQALASRERIQRFLNWWTLMIVAVAALALLSEWGFDPMDSYRLTHYIMKDRLCLNTWIFDNPNALGHSVVPALIMLYFLGFWKRSVFMKAFTVIITAVPVYCIFLTQSKGAYLVAFVSIIAMLGFKRPKSVQIAIVLLAATAGWAAMNALPRMNELETASKEAGIQGRMAAFRFGYNVMHTRLGGTGYNRFVPEFEAANKFPKAPHSSYVRVGGETGAIGLFLFLGILYCCGRTLVACKCRNDAEERIRRLLFVLLVATAVSSWMVDMSFRASFFLMAGATAAFHRLLLGNQVAESPEAEPEPQAEKTPMLPAPALQGAGAGTLPLAVSLRQTNASVPASDTAEISCSGEEQPPSAGITWNRLGWIDWGLIALLTLAANEYWHYIMRNI